MLLRVDRSSTEPLFEQLVRAIRVAIARGDADAGERLPSARDLAESLDVNVHTVLRAYQVLRADGLIELRRGRGAVVGEAARDYTALHDSIASVVRESRRLGLSPDVTTSLLKDALS